LGQGRVFGGQIPPRPIAQEIVEKTGQAVEAAKDACRLDSWRLVDCGGEKYALVRADNEAERYPNGGSVDVATVERFIETRERERW